MGTKGALVHDGWRISKNDRQNNLKTILKTCFYTDYSTAVHKRCHTTKQKKKTAHDYWGIIKGQE